ncbi:MAG: hypothetical protein IJU04_02105 [Ruminococcus sp.]|nr:hypothetical protein [Ruminococcus sp.]
MSFIKKELYCKKSNQYILFLVLITIAFFIKLWKAQYGISEYDESFYLSIPHRMSLGDSLFINEWHVSQMSGLLLYPFYWLYMSVAETTEGIVLMFRYCYVVVHLLVVLYVYYSIRNNGFLTVFGCLAYFLFTPFQLMALSYNTIGMDLVILTSVMLLTYKYKRKSSVIKLIIAGFFFAAAILCCPYLVLIYILLFVLIMSLRVISHKSKKEKLKTEYKDKTIHDTLTLNSFVFFTLGCIIQLGIFITYVLSHMKLKRFLKALKYILSDPEHDSSFLTKTIRYFKHFFISTHPIYIAALFLLAVAFMVMLFDRNRLKHICRYIFAVCCFDCIFFLFSRDNIALNSFMIPISLIGVFVFVLSKEKKWNIFVGGYLFGILYSIALNYSSNTGLYAISIGFSVSTVYSFILINVFLKERFAYHREKHNITNKSVLLCMAVIMTYFFGIEMYYNVNISWLDKTVVYPKRLTETIEKGPLKGVYTTTYRKRRYELIYNDLMDYKKLEKKPILCLTNQCWLYLGLEDFDYSTYSAWLPETKASLDRLEEYYDFNPDKKPYYVYIPDLEKWEDISIPIQFFESKGYTCKKCNSGYKLKL